MGFMTLIKLLLMWLQQQVIYDAKYTTKGKAYKVGREEFETVGLIPWENKNVISITENDIRRENNYSNRAWYFSSIY